MWNAILDTVIKPHVVQFIKNKWNCLFSGMINSIISLISKYKEENLLIKWICFPAGIHRNLPIPIWIVVLKNTNSILNLPNPPPFFCDWVFQWIFLKKWMITEMPPNLECHSKAGYQSGSMQENKNHIWNFNRKNWRWRIDHTGVRGLREQKGDHRGNQHHYVWE